MAKITKRSVDTAETGSKDYVIWDDELPGFGLRVFASGKRSYVIQYRSRGRSRRYTIGLHGVWTPETARREAKAQLGRVAHGDDPAEEQEEDRKALTIKQLCEQYIADMEAGLILGKGGRPKKETTIATDVGRIRRHIIPLLGTRRVRDITKPDMNNLMKDIIAGKSRVTMKTEKLRGKAIVRGGRGTATRTMGLLVGICPEAVELLKDKHVPVNAFTELRKMKPLRQIEAAQLMVAMNKYSIAYARSLVGATPPALLVDAAKSKKMRGLSDEQIALMEQESASLDREFRLLEETYGSDHLDLVIATGYVKRLIENARVVRYLAQNYPELLMEFQKITESTQATA